MKMCYNEISIMYVNIKRNLCQSYSSNKSKNKINLLQPLNVVQLEMTNNNKRQLQYVKEINKLGEFSSNVLDMNKRFIALFISFVCSLTEAVLLSIPQSYIATIEKKYS